jgi:hypothetical protein
VLTGSSETSAIMATTALESTPPERNAPSGTSEIILNLTDSRRRSTSSALASAELIGLSSVNRTSQNSFGALTAAPRWSNSVCAGGSLAAPEKIGAWLRDISQREIFLDRLRIEIASQPAVGEQRFELGTEDELAVGEERVEQRLHSQPVAGEEERFAIAVPQRECEHAAEARDAGFAPGFPRVDDDLGIAPGAEHVAQRHQFGINS